LERVGKFLRHAPHRALLDRYLDTSKSKACTGVYLDRRRYLDFAAISSLVGESASVLIDDLISRKLMYRGFVFGCGYCRNADWFSVDDVTHEFTCRRCSRTQTYSRKNWKIPNEPSWFYKLDELLYQGYRHGMAVSLLALDFLRQGSRESFTFTTDREFWKQGSTEPDVETDLFCVSDGVFMVGEAKKEDSLGATASEEMTKLGKYKNLAERLRVREVVFATLCDKWRPTTVQRVQDRL
jgi:hypothetical protein